MVNGSDIEDLIGSPPVSKLDKAARVLSELTASRRRSRSDEEEIAEHYTPLNAADVQHGVTVGLLSSVFGMDPTTIKKKLKDCTPLARRKAGYVYDMKIAAQYLVKPVFNAEEYLRNMKASELPTHLQDEYWSAQVKRQKWEENAGQLWRTENVIQVLGDVLQKVKFAMQLWPDNVERATGLSDDQRKMLVSMSDELLKEVHTGLLQLPLEKATPSTMAETHERVAPAVVVEDDLI